MAGSLEAKRLSMNTVLKNARIFEDDSWDAETAGFVKCTNVDVQNKDCASVINSEPKEGELGEEKRHFKNILIESEQETFIQPNTICKELDSDQNDSLDEVNFKKAPEKHVNTAIKAEAIPNTPIKNEVYQDESNPSPFNKELFRNFNIESQHKEHVQQKIFHVNMPMDFTGVKTKQKVVKKVFVKEELVSDECNTPEENVEIKCSPERLAIKKRLGCKQDYNLQQKRPRKEMETDSVTLSRRQKQIDYGKNTVGYDNYIKKVPKNERTLKDPKTPNKYIQYSRRAWDGIIRKWRLQLHKYEPVDN